MIMHLWEHWHKFLSLFETFTGLQLLTLCFEYVVLRTVALHKSMI